MKIVCTRAVFSALAFSLVLPFARTFAEERVLEEIIVTARQQEETLQDVPVTVAAVSEETLDRYNITTLSEASKLVPNFQIFHGGSGNGSNIRLRGIGSSSISAAFDQSVAINIDGVVVNIGRFIHNAYMDMGGLEVLKGPQSLYFGKSATAGVVSITSNDPGEEWEFEAGLGYEIEYDQQYYDAVLSGPITDTFGVRLAVGQTKSDELFKNLWPGVQNKYRGEEATNARLTLVWDATDTFSVRYKYARSDYENDGANGRTEEECPEGVVQPTAIPSAGTGFAIFQGIDDCRLNGNTSINDLNPILALGLPYGGDNGVPFLEQETDFHALRLDWDLNENFNLRSTTGYVDLDHIELDVYDYNAGVFGGQHRNTYEALSEELILTSNLDGPFNFMVGAYYQDVEQRFEAYQYAFNLALVPNFLNFDPATQPISAALGFDTTPGAVFGPDPATGQGSDYTKIHFLDTEVFSVFVAGYFDVSDTIEITAGVRYTEEEKDGRIDLPYFHAAASLFGFGGFSSVEDLEFDDDNISPEFAVNWYVTDEISTFFAYKKGFKSGGVDNSALPTAALNPNSPSFDGFDFLYYDSEEAEGFEVGMKARLLDGALRWNATAFRYEYTDLQVQLFNAIIIQFETFNASELLSQGIETEFQFLTPVDGLSLRGNFAITDVSYEDDFINASGQNLKGEDGIGSADVAAALGFSYDFELTNGWRMDISSDMNYNDGYPYSATLDPYEQDAFILWDAALRFYKDTENGSIEFALIGRNLTDEIYAFGTGARPGACANNQSLTPGGCNAAAPANDQDQVTTTSLGRQFTAQVRFRF